MRSASAFRFSKGCSSLNLERMLTDLFGGIKRVLIEVPVKSPALFGQQGRDMRTCRVKIDNMSMDRVIDDADA